MRGILSGLEKWQQLLASLVVAGATIAAVLIPILLISRGSGPATQSTPTTDRSASPVTSVAVSPTTIPLQPSAGPPPVLYTATRDLTAGFAADLDNRTWAVAPVTSQPSGADIYLDGSGNLSGYDGKWGILRSQSGNGYQECADFTAFAASLVPISGLGAGTRLCVRTSESRVGLLIVRGVSGRDFTQMISLDVTVWT
jgi:hypothetical protein